MKRVDEEVRQRSPKLHLLCLCGLGLVALLIRGPWIGDPILHVDDQFYLVVADRMWHGDLPYVSVWDRKPIGLFLLYALFRPLSEDGIVPYQIAAMLFAIATAFVIVRLALRLVPFSAAVTAGALYILYIPALGGNGGQSPVFYNLFMAGAALLIVRATEQASYRDPRSHGLLAMSLVGIAIQVKYTSFVEGIFFGLWLMAIEWSRNRRLVPLLVSTTLFAFCALIPTALALSYFYIKDAGWIFIQSNFMSIFQTESDVTSSSPNFLYWTCIKIAPLSVIFILSLFINLRRLKESQPVSSFFILWCLAAFFGFIVIGRFYSHYALPLVMPMIILIAPIFRRTQVAGAVIACCFFVAVVLIIEPAAARKAKDRQYINQMIEVLAPYAQNGCLYLRDGPPIIYLLGHTCLPTPYIFPEHLTTKMESRATGASEAMKKLVDGRPSAIVLSDREMQHQSNITTMAMLTHLLAESYRLETSITEPNGVDHQDIYVRLDLNRK